MKPVKKDFKFNLEDMKHPDRNHYTKWITRDIKAEVIFDGWRRKKWGYRVMYHGDNMSEDLGRVVAKTRLERAYGRLLVGTERGKYWSANSAFDAMMGDLKSRWWYFKLPRDRTAEDTKENDR